MGIGAVRAGTLITAVAFTLAALPGCGESKECTYSGGMRCLNQTTYKVDTCGALLEVISHCSCGCGAAGSACKDCGCTEEEVWNGTECTPLLTCGEGSALDPETGTCVPKVISCGPGTQDDGAGRCVPETLPEATVPESEEENDVQRGGVPTPFVLPEGEGKVSLGGVIDTPEDRDGDCSVDPDADSFTFTVDTPTLLRIRALSLGPANPAFAVWMMDEQGELAFKHYNVLTFERYGVDSSRLETTREVYLPSPGSYLLHVSDHLNMTDIITSKNTRGQVGGDAFGYLMEVERLPLPQPEALGALPAEVEGTLDQGALRFYTLSGLQAGQAFTVSSQPSISESPLEEFTPAVMVLGPDGALVRAAMAGAWDGTVGKKDRKAEVLFMPDVSGDFLVVQDFRMANVPAPLYTLQVKEEQVLDCAAVDCAQGQIPAGEQRLLRWPLTPGQLNLFQVYRAGEGSQEPAPDFELTLYSSALHHQLYPREGLPRSFDTAADFLGSYSGYYPDSFPIDKLHDVPLIFPFSETEAYLRLQATGDEPRAYTIEPLLIPAGEIQPGVPYQDSVHEIFPGEPGLGLASFSASAGQIAILPDFFLDGVSKPWSFSRSIYTMERMRLGPGRVGSPGHFGAQYPFMAYIPADGVYLHTVHTYSAGSTYSTTLTFQDVSPLGEPLVGKPITALAKELDPQTGLYFFTFQPRVFSSFRITVTPEAGSTIIPRLRRMSAIASSMDASLEEDEIFTVASQPGEAISYEFSVLGGVPNTIWAVKNEGEPGAAGRFDVQVELLSPPENSRCDQAEPLELIEGSAEVKVNIARGANEVEFGCVQNCTGETSAGPDLFYRLNLQEGDTVLIADQHTSMYLFSPCFYLLKDCVDPLASCAVGGARHLIYIVPPGEGGSYILGFDGCSKNRGGEIRVTVTVKAGE